MKDTPTGKAIRAGLRRSLVVLRKELGRLRARELVLRKMRREAPGSTDRIEGELEGIEQGIAAMEAAENWQGRDV